MILVALGGLILILPLWYIWEWWTEGTLGGTEAIGLSLLFFVVFGQMVAFDSLRPALFLLLLASAVVFPFLSSTLERVADSRLKTDMLATYSRAIDADPTNTAARLQLAQTLYKMDRLDDAIAEMEAAFGVSRMSFQEEAILADWKEERRLRDTRNLICDSCGKENERGMLACAACGRRLPQGKAADWMKSGGPVAALRAWMLAVATVAIVLFVCALFPRLPSPNPPFVTLLGFGAWLAFYLLKRRKQ